MVIKSIVSQTSGRLDDHLQKHEDVYDPTIKRNTNLLVGEKGDNGMCKSITLIEKNIELILARLDKIDAWFKWLALTVGGAIIAAIVYIILSHGAEIVK
jgi:hypothetical protein